MKFVDLKKRLQKKEGLATLEAAIVMLLLIFLTFGVMEYSWLFHRIEQVTNCARAGARQAVLPDSTAVDVQVAVDTLATQFGLAGQSHVLAPGDITILDSGDLITVTVSVPYPNIQLLGLSLFPMPDNLTGSVTMAKESP